jgi:hypothetical protein
MTTGILYARDFKIDGDVVVLSSEAVQVRPETRFVPVEIGEDQPSILSTSTSEAAVMDKVKFIKDLIANDATEFTAEDEPWLTSLSEAQLKKLEPKKTPTPAPAPTPALNTASATPQADPTAQAAADQARQAAAATQAAAQAAAAAAKPKTLEQYISDAPKEIQSVLSQGLKLQKDRRDHLVKGLLATNRCKFTKEQLEAKDIDELETLSQLAAVPDYSGQAPVARQNAGDDRKAPEAPQAFPIKKAAA